MLVLAVVVLEGADDDAREIVARLFRGSAKALNVIILVSDDMGAILGGNAEQLGRALGYCPVIGATRNEDLAAPRAGPRNRRGSCHCIGAVLLKLRPCGMRHDLDEQLCEFDHGLARFCAASSTSG